jgi:hypothetical protein
MSDGLSAKDRRELVAAQLTAALIGKRPKMDVADAVELFRTVLSELKVATKQHWKVTSEQPTPQPEKKSPNDDTDTAT